MQKLSSANKRFYLIIAALFVLLLGWLLWNPVWNAVTPKPLGDKLEYIGKEDYGCWMICDSNPASIYYYATDMTPEEVAEYFKSAKLFRPIENDLNNIRIWLVNTANDKDFIIAYYNDSSFAKNKNIKETSSHIVTIPSFNYQLAKDSL